MTSEHWAYKIAEELKKDIKVYPNMLIGQISFWVPKGKIKLYNGKYQNSIGPKAFKIHKDKK